MSNWMKYAVPMILMISLLLLPSEQVFATPNAPGFVSDEFDAGALSSSWVPVTTGTAGQTVTVTGGHAVITAPAGVEQTIIGSTGSPTFTYNVPRIVQSFGGTGTDDFGVEVKFDSIPTQKFQQEGVVIERNPTDVLRIEYHSDGTNLRFYARQVYFNGTGVSAPILVDVKVDPAQVTGASSLYIRVTRTGTTWAFDYKTSSMTDFVTAPWFSTAVPPKTYAITNIGVFAGTSGGTSSPGFTANVDYFRNTAASAPVIFNGPFNVMLPVINR